MKRKYRLKSAKKAILHGFHNGDFSGADQIAEHNQAILNDVFKRIQFGLVDFAYINTGDALGGNLYVISRDTVYSSGSFGAVRVSCFWRRGSGSSAEFLASSHKTYGTLAEFRRDCLLPSGWLHVGADWRENIQGVA